MHNQSSCCHPMPIAPSFSQTWFAETKSNQSEINFNVPNPLELQGRGVPGPVSIFIADVKYTCADWCFLLQKNQSTSSIYPDKSYPGCTATFGVWFIDRLTVWSEVCSWVTGLHKTCTSFAISMSSGNVVIIPVDGSKNSDRAVSCKSQFEYYCIVSCSSNLCAIQHEYKRA